jgi:CheY-like chemotaxis protein
MPAKAFVIDDDPIHIEVARALLAARGYDVGVAQTAGTIGTQYVGAELLLLDLNLPDFDGVEFLGALRKHDYRGQIIIVSGALVPVRRAAANLARAYGLSLLGLIEKPLTGEKLDALLDPGKGAT